MILQEPRLEPDEERPAITAGCGCEVWHGEYTVVWEGRTLCPDCFRSAVEKMLEDRPEQLADELGLEVTRIE